MSVRIEAKEILRNTLNRSAEKRNFVPVSSAHKKLWKLVTQKYPDDASQQQVMMARYSPLAEWLAAPRTLDGFNDLKSEVFDFACYVAKDQKWMMNREKWEEAIPWLLELSAALNIMPQRSLDDIPKLRKETMGHGVWVALEGGPQVCRYVKVHHDLESMVRGLNEHRNPGLMAIPIRRLGMIIGDFRVGAHSAHNDFIHNAKAVLGRWGKLLVITPSRASILATTPKATTWPDGDRLSSLANNKYVDYIYLADIPSKFWRDPGVYWRAVWAKINPDFIFLGEENHPLQAVYELQCKYLGGILLIDNQPVTRRSEDLISI